jgi:type II secretory pathway component PulM
MSTLAVATGAAMLAWVGLVVLLVIALVVVALFNRVVRPALEIKRYADHILEAGVGIATNLDGVDELARTRDLATAVPGLATAYLEQVKRRL